MFHIAKVFINFETHVSEIQTTRDFLDWKEKTL